MGERVQRPTSKHHQSRRYGRRCTPLPNQFRIPISDTAYGQRDITSSSPPNRRFPSIPPSFTLVSLFVPFVLSSNLFFFYLFLRELFLVFEVELGLDLPLPSFSSE